MRKPRQRRSTVLNNTNVQMFFRAKKAATSNMLRLTGELANLEQGWLTTEEGQQLLRKVRLSQDVVGFYTTVDRALQKLEGDLNASICQRCGFVTDGYVIPCPDCGW